MKKFILLVVFISISLFFFDEIEHLCVGYFQKFEVREVLENPRRFEKLPMFKLKGFTGKGQTIPGFSTYTMIDGQTREEVYIISNGKTIPQPGEYLEITVKIRDQIAVFGWDILLLEEKI